jgi:peptide/nickel transport system permease protein
METTANKEETRSSSLLRKSLRRLIRNKASIAGLCVVFTLVFVAIFCSILAPFNPNTQNWGQEYKAPSSTYKVGTDDLGRDILSRLLWGARTSLMVGVVSVSIMIALGVTLGAVSGYVGGAVDNILMRVTEIIMTLPDLILLLLIASILKANSLIIIMAMIGFLNWPSMARVVRSQYLSFKEQNFVEAAKSYGASSFSIIFKHILPNSASPIIVIATLNIASAILTEAALSFLGFGDPDSISWGNMIMRGAETMRFAPWIAIAPGLCIFITVVGLNLLGDGLRDALDVRL